jgi:hypothetical protein
MAKGVQNRGVPLYYVSSLNLPKQTVALRATNKIAEFMIELPYMRLPQTVEE